MTAESVADDAGGAPIRLHVYDSRALDVPTWTVVKDIVTQAFDGTGIRFEWYSCADTATARRCPSRPGQADIIVRVVDSHPGRAPNHCGLAAPEAAGVGFISLATECANRAVTRLRRLDLGIPTAVSAAEVLGFTMAHELAHVLLPGVPHSDDGIFTGRLNRQHWIRARGGRLGFLHEDVARLRAARRYDAP